MNERKNDPVNNPKHYTDGCSVECIDMMQTALGWDGVIYFCLGNAYKYLWRHNIKNNPEEDLAKAKWYIDRAVVMAQDDPDSYGYLLSTAEPLMRLVETYTILHQSIKAMENLDDSSLPELKDKEEDNNLKSITEILDDERTHDITRKHDACCSSLFKTENKEEDDSEDWKEVYDLLGTIIDNAYVPNKYLISAFNIARKHCGCDS